MKKHYDIVDVLKGVAITSVMLYHSIIVFPVNIRDNYSVCNWIYYFLGTFQMPLFFMISGFLYSCRDYKTYIKKRTLRILVPFLIFSLINIPLQFFGGSLVNGEINISQSLIDVFLRGEGYWFLYVLFIISAIFPLFEKIAEKTKLFLPILLVILMVASQFKLTDIFRLQNVVLDMIYFIIGYLIKINLDGITAFMNKRKYTAFAVTTILWLGLFNIKYFFDDNKIYFIKIIAAVCACFSIFIIFNYFVKTKSVNNIMKACGKYSLQFYIQDGYYLTILRLIFVNILHFSNPALIIISIFIPSMVLSYIVSRYILDSCNPFRFIVGIPMKKKEKIQ